MLDRLMALFSAANCSIVRTPPIGISFCTAAIASVTLFRQIQRVGRGSDHQTEEWPKRLVRGTVNLGDGIGVQTIMSSVADNSDHFTGLGSLPCPEQSGFSRWDFHSAKAARQGLVDNHDTRSTLAIPAIEVSSAS